MKNKLLILSVLIFTLLSSCKVKEGFITSAPPIQPFFIDQVGISYCSPPRIMLPLTKTIDEIEISSQYFKIAVPLVLDRSGKAEAIKNLIDEQFVTALDKTKRFIVMDKSTMLNIISQTYETGIYSEKHDSTNKDVSAINQKVQYAPTIPIVNPSESNTQNPTVQTVNTITQLIGAKKNVSQLFGKLELNDTEYQQYLQLIEQYTDGILRITITGFDDKKKQLEIDYKINSSLSDNYILYTGKGKIGFSMEINTSTLLLNRDDIENIVEEIVKSFPNPDLTTLQIIQINGKKITVNSGKKDNIKIGMLGYVIRQEGKRIAYRAMFEVTEVFPEAFNAELKVEPLSKINVNRGDENRITAEDIIQYKNLLNTIKVGEPVKMK